MKNLKITALLASPLSFNYDILFDTLLISAKAKGLKMSDDEFNADNAINVQDIVRYLGDIPLCSKGFVEGIEGTAKYYKRFDEDSELFACNKKIETGKGKFKNYSNTINTIHSSEIIFYCFGDKEKISKLLEKVYSIGKKISQGYGIVREWKIEECNEINWFDIDTPFRPIPCEMFKSNNKNRKVVAYKFPYWYKGNKKLCYV